MIESMVTSIVHNISDEINGKEPYCATECRVPGRHGRHRCRVRCYSSIPPRNVAWFKKESGAHGEDRLRKILYAQDEKGTSEPLYEKYILKMMGIQKLGD